jgi:hypothetical protein
VAQRRHHFYVGRLPDFETHSEHPLCEALLDNTKSPPDETVCLKLDFLAWLASLTERDRGIVEDLMIGEWSIVAANRVIRRWSAGDADRDRVEIPVLTDDLADGPAESGLE